MGVGGTLAYNFKAFGRPSSLRIRGLNEMDARNRLEGHSLWLVWAMPAGDEAAAGPAGRAAARLVIDAESQLRQKWT